MPEKELPRTVSRPVFNTYALTVCALLTALSVVLARVLTLIPAETTRISLEAVPIVLSGLLFGPIPGAVVGFCRSHRLPVLPLRLQSHFLRAPHPVRPAGRCGTAVCDGPASPAPHGAGLLPRGHRGLRLVAEHGAGSGVRRRCQAGIFSGKAGVPQHPIRPHRHGGHADRVAAAAPRRTQRCAAAYPGQGRRRA